VIRDRAWPIKNGNKTNYSETYYGSSNIWIFLILICFVNEERIGGGHM